MHRGFWWGNLKEGNHLQGLSIDRMIIINCILKKYEYDGRIWTG
jgi:hypothetical protein